MTRTEAERIAADRNRGARAGVTHYARMSDIQFYSGPMNWIVIQNDNGYERIIRS